MAELADAPDLGWGYGVCGWWLVSNFSTTYGFLVGRKCGGFGGFWLGIYVLVANVF